MKKTSKIAKLLCMMGWHQFNCKLEDYINEFGYVPTDGRVPKFAKCSRCGKTCG